MLESGRMKWLAASAALALCLAGGALMASADSKSDAARMGSWIPKTAGPWLSEADHVYDADGIFEYIDGAGEVYRSYNMKLLVSRRFHKDGRPDLVVDLFDMGRPEDAFGVFTHDLDGDDAAVGQGSTYKGGLLSFWKGRYFGSVFAEEESPAAKEAVLELGRRIAEAIPETGRRPWLVDRLPKDGLEADRVRFFHNYSVLNYHFFVADADVLLLGQTAEAVLATYKRPEGKSVLLLVGYPGEKEAERGLASFVKAYMPEAKGTDVVRTENKKWSAARRAGAVVAVVFDAGSEELARKQLAEVESLLRQKPGGIAREGEGS